MESFTCEICGKSKICISASSEPQICIDCLPIWAILNEEKKKNMNTKENSVMKQSDPMAQSINQGGGQMMPSLDSQIISRKIELARMEQHKELKDAAKPLQDYLRKYHNPHCTVHVDSDRVGILEGIVSIPFNC